MGMPAARSPPSRETPQQRDRQCDCFAVKRSFSDPMSQPSSATCPATFEHPAGRCTTAGERCRGGLTCRLATLGGTMGSSIAGRASHAAGIQRFVVALGVGLAVFLVQTVVAAAPALAVSNQLTEGQTLANGAQIASSDGRYRLVMQADGNLVVYRGSSAQWATGTNGPNRRVVMQGDGNLVVYTGSTPLWASGTAGFRGSRLVMQNDGNLVIYGPSGHAWWSRYSGRLQPKCYGDYCSGRDPQQTGCSDDAVTTRWVDVTSARLELRWSPICKTNWARYQQYPRGWFLGNVPLEMRAVQDTGYTQRRSYGVNGTPEGTTWTPMIYSPVRLVRAEMVYQCGPVGDCVVGALTGQNPVVTGWG